jgi:hypothetical protein
MGYGCGCVLCHEDHARARRSEGISQRFFSNICSLLYELRIGGGVDLALAI